MTRCGTGLLTASGVALLVMVPSPVRTAGVHGDQQVPPASTFRSTVTAVPVNVRVVDADGRPVTNLRQDEFVVYEDGVRQTVAHFVPQLFTALAAGASEGARPDLPLFDGAPQKRRVFLIVAGTNAFGTRPLGPGTAFVHDPSGSLDGLLHFVRERLLPQDQVALIAYDRATDFSADHERIATILEAFRGSPEHGLAALARDLLQTPVSQPRETIPMMPSGDGATAFDGILGLAEYVRAREHSTSDFERLLYGINYLRFMDGEKHLVFVAEQGLIEAVPSTPDSAFAKPFEHTRAIARAAADARVAVHSIQTGGIPAEPGSFQTAIPAMTPRILVEGQTYFGMVGSYSPTSGDLGLAGASAWRTSSVREPWAAGQPPPLPVTPGLDAQTIQAHQSLQALARDTGGMVSILGKAADAVDRIDAQTRVDYLLVYYPANTAADGRFREIKVEVTRPGARVSWRHGYYPTSAAPAAGPRTLVADGRLAAAMSSRRTITDVAFTAAPAFVPAGKGRGGDATLHLVIDASRLGWSTDSLSRHVARLDLGVLCGDARDGVVGQARVAVDVALTDARYEQVTKGGLPYDVHVPVSSKPRFFKIAVYSHESKLTGSAVVWLK